MATYEVFAPFAITNFSTGMTSMGSAMPTSSRSWSRVVRVISSMDVLLIAMSFGTASTSLGIDFTLWIMPFYVFSTLVMAVTAPSPTLGIASPLFKSRGALSTMILVLWYTMCSLLTSRQAGLANVSGLSS